MLQKIRIVPNRIRCLTSTRTTWLFAWPVLIISWVERTGLRPEKEKLGFLLPQQYDDHKTSHRRPANVFVPAFNGGPIVFDLANTAFQRLDILAEAGHVAGAAATACTEVKRKYLRIAELCAAQNGKFQSIVVESTGTRPEAAKVLQQLARTAAVYFGEDADLAQAHLFQEGCILIRGYHALAVLRRRTELNIG